MRRHPELAAGLVLTAALAVRASAEPANDPAKGEALFDAGNFANRKEPIIVTSDTLEYDYKANVVVYRGTVLAAQGPVKLRSDTLTVTLAAAANGDPTRATEGAGKPTQRLQQIVAVGNVRIDHGARWATGGRAVFDQGQRTLVLTENPVMHEASNEVAGDRVVVFLDENRSIVEGGRKRVKAVLYPNKDGGLAPSAAPSSKAAPTSDAASAEHAAPGASASAAGP